MAGYSAYRIFEETIRIDSSAYFLGLRLNFFIALLLTITGLVWFAVVQRRGGQLATADRPGPVTAPGRPPADEEADRPADEAGSQPPGESSTSPPGESATSSATQSASNPTS